MTTRNLILTLAAALVIGAASSAAYADGPGGRPGWRGPHPNHGPIHGSFTFRHGYRHHRCEYIPGHYETRTVEFWVPGYWSEQYTPPEYCEFRGPRGCLVRVMVRPATTNRVWVPGRTEYRTESFWVPGTFACGCR